MSQDSYISSILHGRLISERRSSLTSSDNSQNLSTKLTVADSNIINLHAQTLLHKASV